jgi:site-specific DNA recombinase
MKNTPQRMIVGYVRVSTYIQAESGHSIKTQKDAIKDRCSILGEDITMFYSDEGESGTRTDRTEYTFLKEQIKAGEIQKVYVFSISRLGRNLPEVINFVELCKKHKTTVVALADSFDSDIPSTYLTLHLLSAIADYQAKETSSRIKSTLNRKKKSGEKYTGNIPIGLKEDPEEKNKLIVDEKDKKIVQRIRNLKTRGYSLSKIAEKLNSDGQKTKTGKEWSRYTVHHYLKIELQHTPAA